MMNMREIRRLSIALFATAIGATCAKAQDATPFYKGKTVTIIVGSSAGGGYDSYARLLARHLGKHLPGDPTIIVSNMLGGGSEVAASYVARVAPKDGTVIAAVIATQALDPILGEAGELNYDASRLNYLGSAMSEPHDCIVRSDAPATTFADMFKTRVIMGGTSANDSAGYFPILLNNVLGTKFKVVLGYPGAREFMKAVESGEINGTCGISWLSLTSQYKGLLAKGAIKIVVQEDNEGVPALNKMGVPLAASYAHDEQRRRILEIVYSQGVFGHPYFVASGVPADRVKLLRSAVMETWRDPDLLADAAKANLEIGPVSGEEVQSILHKIYASPPALLKSVKQAIRAK